MANRTGALVSTPLRLDLEGYERREATKGTEGPTTMNQLVCAEPTLAHSLLGLCGINVCGQLSPLLPLPTPFAFS